MSQSLGNTNSSGVLSLKVRDKRIMRKIKVKKKKRKRKRHININLIKIFQGNKGASTIMTAHKNLSVKNAMLVRMIEATRKKSQKLIDARKYNRWLREKKNKLSILTGISETPLNINPYWRHGEHHADLMFEDMKTNDLGSMPHITRLIQSFRPASKLCDEMKYAVKWHDGLGDNRVILPHDIIRNRVFNKRRKEKKNLLRRQKKYIKTFRQSITKKDPKCEKMWDATTYGNAKLKMVENQTAGKYSLTFTCSIPLRSCNDLYKVYERFMPDRGTELWYATKVAEIRNNISVIGLNTPLSFGESERCYWTGGDYRPLYFARMFKQNHPLEVMRPSRSVDIMKDIAQNTQYCDNYWRHENYFIQNTSGLIDVRYLPDISYEVEDDFYKYVMNFVKNGGEIRLPRNCVQEGLPRAWSPFAFKKIVEMKLAKKIMYEEGLTRKQFKVKWTEYTKNWKAKKTQYLGVVRDGGRKRKMNWWDIISDTSVKPFNAEDWRLRHNGFVFGEILVGGEKFIGFKHKSYGMVCRFDRFRGHQTLSKFGELYNLLWLMAYITDEHFGKKTLAGHVLTPASCYIKHPRNAVERYNKYHKIRYSGGPVWRFQGEKKGGLSSEGAVMLYPSLKQEFLAFDNS